MKTNNIRVDFRQYDFDLDFPVKAFMDGTYYMPVPETEALTYMHFHNSLELGCCHTGSGNLYVDGRVLPFSAGDVVMVRPYVTHYVKPAYVDGERQPMFCEWLYFDTQILQSTFHSTAFYAMLNSLNEQKAAYMIISQGFPMVSEHVRVILDELRAKRPNYQLYILGLIFNLCLDLSRVTTESAGEQITQRTMATVFPAVEYIHEHVAEEIDLHRLADLCYMSPTHFRRVFKSVMHTSPSEYIHHERILAACRLLYTTDLPVLHICYQVGFNTVSCFNRQFIKAIGTSPLQWRKQARAHGSGRPYFNA